MKENNNHVVIIEGMQGSGKTTATKHLSEMGCKSVRGIPTGQELSENREVDNWKKSIGIFEMATNDSNNAITVMDRSIWSLVAYNIRKNPKLKTLFYELGKNMFKRKVKDGSKYLIVFLETNPNLGYCREDKHGVHSHKSTEEASQEAEVYQWLTENLKKDGFNITKINNCKISKEEFLNQVKLAVDERNYSD